MRIPAVLCVVFVTLSQAQRPYEDFNFATSPDAVGTLSASTALPPPSLPSAKRLARVLPSKEAIESFGVRFLDALIKRGQMEMAKGAFKTQLEVLEKVNPEQYEKYKNVAVDDLAADAVRQQAQLAAMQPKTGNAFVDMLHENGIPIGSSIKGIEQAIKTQKEMENNDPSEQIAKVVFEKFREQILPGLVANMIAGRNPFRMPNQMRPMQAMPDAMRQQAMAQQQGLLMTGNSLDADSPEIRRSEPRSLRQRVSQDDDEDLPSDMHRSYDEREDSNLAARLRSSPRLAALLENPSVVALLHKQQRAHDEPLGRSLSDRVKQKSALEDFGARSALALGLNNMLGDSDEEDGDTEEEIKRNEIRRAPLKLPPEFVSRLSANPEVASALSRLNYRVDDVAPLLMPKERMFNPKPQPGFMVPRKIPKRPRKMIPLLVGVPEVGGASSSIFGPIRRSPDGLREKPMTEHNSRVIQNLKNNPNIAPLFLDDDLERKLRGREMLSPEQKGLFAPRQLSIRPRLFGAKLHEVTDLDRKVHQVIEERPVPPLVFIPRGKHTRLRWTGATEREIPGLGTRMILPSLDPTAPAVNTALSTQGRARDEWDTMFKVPNNWNPGDEVGFSVKQKSERFIGGTGNFDMPAAHL